MSLIRKKMANMDQTPIADPLSTLTSQAFVEQVQTNPDWSQLT